MHVVLFNFSNTFNGNGGVIFADFRHKGPSDLSTKLGLEVITVCNTCAPNDHCVSLELFRQTLDYDIITCVCLFA